MLDPYVLEQAVLDLAVAQGTLSQEAILEAERRAVTGQTLSHGETRWGPRCEQLIADGVLRESQVRQLVSCVLAVSQTLTSPPSGALRPSASNRTDQAEPDEFPVHQWARYRFIKLLGRGGMGTVYEAFDPFLKRRVALKFIRTQELETVKRFLQEARAQAKIDHPGVCKVFEVGEVQGKPYISMQFVDGTPLDRSMKDLSLFDKVSIIREAADALHSAHRLGILHRDIKPSNIMLIRDGENRPHPIIMDFGLAREDNADSHLTETGAVMGTPAYMSPEQARGDIRSMDRRSDVYSIGATLYELLSGRPPFVAGSVAGLLVHAIHSDPPAVRSLNTSIPHELETITMKTLMKDPSERYNSARELADELQRYLNGDPIVAKPDGMLRSMKRVIHKNIALSVAVFFAVIALLSGVAYGVYERRNAENARKRSEHEAEEIERVSREAKNMEWLTRTAYSLPLHDTRAETQVIRQRMELLERQFGNKGTLGNDFADYALGRGYMALHDYENAYKHLSKIEKNATRIPGAYYALGRTLIELYQGALENLRRTTDGATLLLRQKALGAQFVLPALSYLQRAKEQGDMDSADYVEGLLAYYNNQEDQALTAAGRAIHHLPWMYEAHKLQGDVYLSRALAARDRGDIERSLIVFDQAITAYEKAGEIARSDSTVFDGLAEIWIRKMETRLRVGKFDQHAFRNAIEMSTKSIAASPDTGNGYIKRAFARYFFHQQRHLSAIEDSMSNLALGIEDAKMAVKTHSDDFYAHEILGLLLREKSDQLSEDIQPASAIIATLQEARAAIEKALDLNKQFVWGYNDLGIVYKSLAKIEQRIGGNPMPLYNIALEMFKASVAMDREYQNGYINYEWTLVQVSEYRQEVGHDPKDEISRSSEMSSKCSIQSSQIVPCLTAVIATNAIGIQHALATGKDASEYFLSIKRLESIIEESKADVELTTLEYLGMAYVLQAETMLLEGKDPIPLLRQSSARLQKCLTNDPKNWWCGRWLARTKMIETDLQINRHQSNDQYRNAIDITSKFLAINNDEPALHNLSVELKIRLAGLAAGRSLNAIKILNEATKEIDRSLKIRASVVTSHALRGVLYTLLARNHASLPERRHYGREAVASFDQARKLGLSTFGRQFSGYHQEAVRLAAM